MWVCLRWDEEVGVVVMGLRSGSGHDDRQLWDAT